jgi:hypothetical protein
VTKRRPRNPRPVTRNTRSGDIQNVTTRTGDRVHESDLGGRALCGWFIRGIVYTASPPNCLKCARVKDGVQ